MPHKRNVRLMKSIVYGCGLLILYLSGLLPAASAQDGLSLRQAIQQALKQNPDGDAARAATDEAKAGAAMARTALLPQVAFTEDMSRGNDPVYVFGTRLRQQRFTQADFDLSALNRPGSIGNFATRISGEWQAFDSLKTQRTIRGADLMKQSGAASAQAVDQKMVLGVVQAYQGVLYAERQVEVAQHELDTAQALLNSANDHVKAGLAVDSDRISAEVNVASRKQGLIGAQGDLQLAWAQLGVAMGTPELKPGRLQPLEAHDYPGGDLEQEFQAAVKNRQDLTAVVHAQGAQAMAESAARLAYGPKVNVYGNWEDDRQTLGGTGGNNWVAGVQVSVDLLPFGKRAQLGHEHAAKALADAQLKSYQQHVRLQVSQAHIQRETAQLSLETARSATEQAGESLRILKNRYEAGLTTITELLRADDAERQSQANYWRAVYGNAVSYAQLLYATGTLTPEAAEGLQ
jgi:outer membrane protein